MLSLVQKDPVVSTTAITGNAASSQATIVPNFNNLGDPMLVFENNLGITKQGKTFDTTFTSSNPVYQYPPITTAPNLRYNWTTAGFTFPREHFIQIPCNVSFINDNWNLATGLVLPLGTYPTIYDPKPFNWAGGLWPNGAWYGLFDSIKLGMGSLNEEIGSFAMSERSQLPFLNVDSTFFAKEELPYLVRLGTPWAQTTGKNAPGGVNDPSATTDAKNSQMIYGTEMCQEYSEIYGQYMQEIYNVWYLNNCASNGLIVENPKPVVMNMCFPLHQLHTFFKNEAMLPISTMIKLDLAMHMEPTLIGEWKGWTGLVDSKVSDKKPAAGPWNKLSLFVSPHFGSGGVHKIVVENYTPRAALLGNYNTSWMTSQQVYLNPSATYVDIPEFSTKDFNVCVNAQMQMPRQLFIGIFNKTATTIYEPLFANAGPLLCNPNSDFIKNPLSSDSLNMGPFGQKVATNYPNALAGGFVWQQLEISISAQNGIKLNQNYAINQYLGAQTIFKDCQHVLLNQLQLQQERVGYESKTNRSSNNNCFYGAYLVLTLDPNQHQRLAETSQDPGAVVINISGAVTKQDGSAIGTNYVVRIMKPTEYQTSIGADNKVSQVFWPASVQSGNKPPAIEGTFNQIN